MDTTTIKRLLKTYKCFKGVFPSDQMPYHYELPLNIIVNTDPSYKPGQHWVGVSINREGVGYYFDSFGFPPTVPSIVEYLNKKSKYWSFNQTKLQNAKSTTCGNYCVLFMIFRCNNLSPRKFISQFTENSVENDIKMRLIF